MATNDGENLCNQEGYELMAAAFEVYNEKGSGFLKAVYQECLEHELDIQNISFKSKPKLKLYYKGRSLNQTYEPDLIVSEKITVELKAVQKLAPEHFAPLFNYLKAAGMKVGYLINFASHPQLEWKRVVR
ncbi:MAG: GxxExxY protein [Verrucomicrobiota bacterium]